MNSPSRYASKVWTLIDLLKLLNRLQVLDSFRPAIEHDTIRSAVRSLGED